MRKVLDLINYIISIANCLKVLSKPHGFKIKFAPLNVISIHRNVLFSLFCSYATRHLANCKTKCGIHKLNFVISEPCFVD